MLHHAVLHAAARGMRPVAPAAVLLAIATTPASAQLGGLMKKARDRVAPGVAPAAAPAAMGAQPAAFDDVIVELDDARVARVIAGLQAGRKDAAAPGGRAALVARRDAAANQAGDLANAHGSAIDAHNRQRWSVDRCRNDAFQARHEARNAQLQHRAGTDPAFRQQMMDLSIKAAQVQASGDSVAFARILTQVRAMSGEGRADTVAVDAKCGPAMATHAIDAQIAALQAQVAQFDDQIRAMDDAAATAEADAAGMNVRQFAMARERIQLFLARLKASSAQQGFSPAELAALGRQAAVLEGLM